MASRFASRRRPRRFSLALLVPLLACGIARGDVSVTFLYRLSDFGGRVDLNQPALAPDREHGELLAVQGSTVRIFGPSGMVVHEFEHDREERGALSGVAALEGGDILLLARHWDPETGQTHPLLTRCDYRGTPRESFGIEGLPEHLGDFFPDVMRVRGGRLFLAGLSRGWVVETDLDGRFRQAWDLIRLLGDEETREVDLELADFDVDAAGTFYVTVPAVGVGYRVPPGGPPEPFGEGTSGRGALGVARGVAVTDRGWVLVADILNQLVLVFDENLRFLTDFPRSGRGQERLLGPVSVVVDGDRVYVGEVGERGVAVFLIAPR
jgi:hypothetical protein